MVYRMGVSKEHTHVVAKTVTFVNVKKGFSNVNMYYVSFFMHDESMCGWQPAIFF